MNPPPRTVAIIGLGLIGGSLARDLSARGQRVTGVDRDRRTVDAALADGALDRGFIDESTESRHADLGDALTLAELVVLAVPVGALPALVARVAAAAPPGAVITDVGSTKRSVVAEAVAAGIGHRFVGGHPMAGGTRSGWAAARPDLFAGAPVWLCPAEGATASAVARVETLWREVGASPCSIGPADHDRLIAWSSHLPQLLASALAASLEEAGVPRRQLGPGGRDTTRLAASDPAVWTGILMDNRDQVGHALGGMLRSLTHVRVALADGDTAQISSLLEKSRHWAGEEAPAGGG